MISNIRHLAAIGSLWNKTARVMVCPKVSCASLRGIPHLACSPYFMKLFISLILRAILLRRAREANILDKKSIEDLLMELAKLRAVKVGGKEKLTEISKKQRTILENMKIGIPVEAILVIKRCGV